jgi:pimeloyl-ACP methyl ester carboxylesterase
VTDKRGTGASTGQWNNLSHADWATDVDAQLDFLRTQPGIDTSRIGLFAGSEGGFVAPVVASRRSDVRFVVCRVCSALPHAPVILDDQRGQLLRRGLTAADAARGAELLDRMMRFALTRTGYDSLVQYANSGAGTPWRSVLPMATIPAADAAYWTRYRGVLAVDPAEHYRRLNVPVLAILGERDDRILVDRHRAVFEAIADAGRDLTLWVVPGATHGLLVGGARLAYPPDLHERIAAWIAAAAAGTTCDPGQSCRRVPDRAVSR